MRFCADLASVLKPSTIKIDALILLVSLLAIYSPVSAFAYSDAGVGFFGSPKSVVVGCLAKFVAAADFDSDLDIDLVVSTSCPQDSRGYVVFLENDGFGEFEVIQTIELEYWVGAIAIADIDNDLDSDVLVATNFDNSVEVIRNDLGSFELIATLDPLTYVSWIVAADFNGDLTTDFAVCGWQGVVRFFKGDGNATFTANREYAVGAKPQKLVASDVNSDGLIDLVSANEEGRSFSILENLGGEFEFVVTENPVPTAPRTIGVCDLNADGYYDVIVPSYLQIDPDSMYVYLADSFGGYHLSLTYQIKENAGSISCADINGDAKVDLVISCENRQLASVFIGKGSGELEHYLDVNLPNSIPVMLDLTDVDSDSDLDLITCNYYASDISIMRNLSYRPGDANSDTMITISDVVFLINYIFGNGAAPNPIIAGDADCNDLITISDAVYLIQYIFSGGNQPCMP